MQAADVVETLPTVRPSDDILSAARMVSRHAPARWCCPLVVVEKEEGGTLGVLTANRLLELLVAAVEDAPR